MLGWVAVVVLGLAGAGAALNAVMALLAGRAPPEPGPSATAACWPGVTVLKPLHGDEPALAAKLASLFAQEYAGAVQVIFGARTPADEGLAVARVAAARAGVDATFVADATRHGTNNKLSNLINMDALGRNPVVVIADSDVAWPADTLHRLVAALAAPGVELVSPLHIGRGDAGRWSRLAAMDISYRFMPSVLLGLAAGLATPVLGPTMALRRETLDRIGGLVAFKDVLADDYELGRAVRAAGMKTAVARFFITHGCAEASWRALVAHELRWTVTIFRIDPAGFAGSLVLHTLPLALLGATLARFSWLADGVLAAAFAARALVKWRMDRACGHVSGPLWLVPFRDILSFGLFVATFFVNKVDWRGSEFRVTRDGRLHSP